MKLKAQKLKMTQIWKNDSVVPISPLKIKEGKIEDITEGDFVTVSGLSKGKGFQGVVKRHGFHGGPKSHGQKNRLRAPGSIGATAPQRVPKGKKMAGHMGMVKVSIKNLRVEAINHEEKTIMVKGAVPGRTGSILEIRK